MNFFENNKKELFNATLIGLGIITVFSLGYFTANLINVQKSPIEVDQLDYTDKNNKNQVPKEGRVVGSVNSDKYHYTDCPGAQMINKENKIFFASVKEAQDAGYQLAANCNK